MATTVYKETFHLKDIEGDKVRLMLPAFSEIFTVAEQFKDSRTLQVWYRCATGNGKVERYIHVVGTGHPAPNKSQARYLSTVVLMGGSLVLHFFDDEVAP